MLVDPTGVLILMCGGSMSMLTICLYRATEHYQFCMRFLGGWGGVLFFIGILVLISWLLDLWVVGLGRGSSLTMIWHFSG